MVLSVFLCEATIETSRSGRQVEPLHQPLDGCDRLSKNRVLPQYVKFGKNKMDNFSDRILGFRTLVENEPADVAIQRLRVAIQETHDNTEKFWAYTCLAKVYCDLNQSDDSLQVLESAWQLKPHENIVNRMLASHYIDRALYPQALAHLILCRQDNGDTWFDIGCALEGMELYRQSQFAFSCGQAISPQEDRFQRRIDRLESHLSN